MKRYQRKPLHSLAPSDETVLPNWLFTLALPQDEMLAYVLLSRLAQNYPDGIINDTKQSIVEQVLTLVVWNKREYATFRGHVEHVIRMLHTSDLIDIERDWGCGQEAWTIRFSEMTDYWLEKTRNRPALSPDGDRKEGEL